MQLAEQVGLNIRVLRTKRKFSQEDLASLMEVERQQLSDIELGKRNLTLKTLERLCLALKCQPVDLFEGVTLSQNKK